MKTDKKTIKAIENKIEKLAKKIGFYGKTDTIEDELDVVEHKINNLSDAGLDKIKVKRLKDLLDEIK